MTVDAEIALLEAIIHAERTTRKLSAVLPLEHRLRRAFSKYWRAQGKTVLTTLARFAPDFPELVEAVDPTELQTAIDRIIYPDPRLVQLVQIVAEKSLVAGAHSAEIDLSIEAAFTVEHPDAVTWLTKYGAERVANIDDVTRRYLRTIVTDAAENGWSYQRTAKAITDRFVEFAVGVPQENIRSRAELVAITEVGEAYEQGAKIIAQGLIAQGLEIEKGWLAEDDACEECIVNVDDGFIAEDDSFSSGDDAPLVHPGCRCDLERKVVGADDTTEEEA